MSKCSWPKQPRIVINRRAIVQQKTYDSRLLHYTAVNFSYSWWIHTSEELPSASRNVMDPKRMDRRDLTTPPSFCLWAYFDASLLNTYLRVLAGDNRSVNISTLRYSPVAQGASLCNSGRSGSNHGRIKTVLYSNELKNGFNESLLSSNRGQLLCCLNLVTGSHQTDDYSYCSNAFSWLYHKWHETDAEKDVHWISHRRVKTLNTPEQGECV